MKFQKLLINVAFVGLASLGVASIASAATLPAGYVGVQIGQGDTHFGKSDVKNVTSANVDSKDLAGRVFAGYQFNENLAAELGYTHFYDAEYKRINATSANGKVKEFAYDLVGKAIMPLPNNFNVYAKAGVANVHAKGRGVTTKKDTATELTYGIGAAYDVTPMIPVDLSWTHTNSGSGIPKSDFVALGISYHFSD